MYQGMVPVLGSSFAFINAIALVLKDEGLGAVKGGIIVAGLIYVLMAGIIKLFGVEKVRSFFPPIVAGPIIMVIGLNLSPTAINNSLFNQGSFDLKYLLVSSIVLITMIVVSIFAKGFLNWCQY